MTFLKDYRLDGAIASRMFSCKKNPSQNLLVVRSAARTPLRASLFGPFWP